MIVKSPKPAYWSFVVRLKPRRTEELEDSTMDDDDGVTDDEAGREDELDDTLEVGALEDVALEEVLEEQAKELGIKPFA